MPVKNTNLKNLVLNIRSSSTLYVLSMFFTMIVRSFMVNYLGKEIVGLNGVLTSVISSLSIADLGVDSVFIFLLYKPLADKNLVEINNLMRLFKKIYIVIGSAFLICGLIILPFLDKIVGSQSMSIDNVQIIFYLFVLNTGLSYFFAYYRILLNADQKYYIIARVTFFVTMVINCLQVLSIVLVSNFLVYAVIQLIGTTFTNFFIGYITKNRYHRLDFSSNHQKTHFQNEHTVTTLVKNTLGGISNKLGSIVVYSSDNILLANFVNLQIVGMYSNYILITQGATSFITKIFASITSNVGNFGVQGDEKSNLRMLMRINFLVNVGMLLLIFPMALCFSMFIRIWLGADNILPRVSVLLIVLNFYLQIIRFPALTYIDAFGLQWIQKWKSIVESIVNVSVSLFLLYFFKMGLIGVLLGTCISNLFVVNWYEPYIVIKQTCGRNYSKYIKHTMIFCTIFILELFCSWILLEFNLLNNSIVKLLSVSVLSLVLNLFIIYFCFRSDDTYQFYKNLLFKKRRERV